MLKICIITCYKDPDYIRARTLRQGLLLNKEHETIIVKNRLNGLLRYPEIIIKMCFARLRHRPNIYVLTFRGYEILPIFNLVTLGKKRIFDEFINPIEWAVYEHKKLRPHSLGARFLKRFYGFYLSHVDLILTDTNVHAEYSANLMNIPLSKYKTVTVSADETVFEPVEYKPGKDRFQVLYFGSMLPLHGLQYILEAADQLKKYKQISFKFVGGGKDTESAVEKYHHAGANVEYNSWVKFEKLPKLAKGSGLCIGGPLGDTVQSRMVVTGKTYQMLCMGMPTLIGETDGQTPFVDKQNCLLVQQADASAISQAVLWAYDNQKSLKTIASEGRKTYEKYFSNKIVAKQMNQAIEQLQA